MSWDNRVFNVNGRGLPMLVATLRLAFEQHGSGALAKGWRFDPEQGLALVWSIQPGDTPFSPPIGSMTVAGLSPEDVAPQVDQWLKSDPAQAMKFEGDDEDIDNDGHNGPGWRVSVPDSLSCDLCVVRPVYLWYGK